MKNYFELYDIPVSFSPDLSLVKKKFYDLSRIYHPDRYTLATPNEQNEALRISSVNNEAYKTLNDKHETLAYVLRLKGILEEDEKYSLPPDFLMEMMEVNEAVSEYEFEQNNEQLKNSAITELNTQKQTIEGSLSELLQQFEQGEQTEELLLKIKDLYFRKKYLLRIQDRIDNIN